MTSWDITIIDDDVKDSLVSLGWTMETNRNNYSIEDEILLTLLNDLRRANAGIIFHPRKNHGSIFKFTSLINKSYKPLESPTSNICPFCGNLIGF